MEKLFNITRYLLFCLCVAALTLVCVYHSSCQLTSQGIRLNDGRENPSPEIQDARLIDETSLEVTFNKKIFVESAAVSEIGQGAASIDMLSENSVRAEAVLSADNKTAVYKFSEPSALGRRYQLFSQIKDERGNTLTFALPFTGFNSHIPQCALVEVQPNAYTTTSKSRNYESPYVSFVAMQDGNLFGLELYSCAKKLSFELPDVKVKKGQIVTLHLKPTKNPEHCVSELGDDLNLSKTGSSDPQKRDLFFDTGKTSVLGTSADVIYIREKNSGKIQDALSFYKVEKEKVSWKYENEIQAAIESGAWKGDATFETGLNTEGCTNTRPLLRMKIPSLETRTVSSAADWQVKPKEPTKPKETKETKGTKGTKETKGSKETKGTKAG